LGRSKTILDFFRKVVEMNNGRVNLYPSPSAGGEGSALNSKAGASTGFVHQTTSEVQFQNDMLRGNWEQNALSTGFFSQANLTRIQTTIRRAVYDRSKEKGYIIGDQSVDELKMIMRGIFYQYAKNLPNKIQDQILELNARVVEWSVPHILSAVDHYMYYLKDIDTLPVPMEQPVLMSRAGSRSKPLNPFM
jgi:hypothetical protein